MLEMAVNEDVAATEIAANKAFFQRKECEARKLDYGKPEGPIRT